MTTNKPILIALGFVVATGVIGSVFSPQNVINILGFCSIVTVSLVGLVKASSTADKVEEVKVDLKKTSQEQQEKLTRIEETGQKTHLLVNSQYGEALRIARDLSDFKYATTGNPEDKEAAEAARAKYEDHQRKQALVDSQHAAH